MVIRKAVIEDTGYIIELAKRFGDEYSMFPIKPWVVTGMVRNCISDGVAIVAEREGVITGGIIGVVAEHPWLHCTVLQELGWYATDRSGGMLLPAFINEGKRLGVDLITASTLTASPAQAAALMQRCGMEPQEQVWTMKIGD